MPQFDVFYMKPEFFGDGIMGYDWCIEHHTLPKPGALGETHIYLGQFEADDLEHLFGKMQADNWSPNGEALPLIEKRGLSHTSMSVGDIVVDEEGICSMVNRYGFIVLLGKPPFRPCSAFESHADEGHIKIAKT